MHLMQGSCTNTSLPNKRVTPLRVELQPVLAGYDPVIKASGCPRHPEALQKVALLLSVSFLPVSPHLSFFQTSPMLSSGKCLVATVRLAHVHQHESGLSN